MPLPLMSAARQIMAFAQAKGDERGSRGPARHQHTGLKGDAAVAVRAGRVEALPNGTRLHHCRVCGRLAAWGFGVALDRGRDGTWFCFEHQGRAG